MPFFLDTQETSQRFGNQLVEFRSLFDADHIRHGSPDDLFEFAKILESSSQFRIDLSTLVKSVMKREHDELLLTDMMSIIATSVGGPTVADTHADIIKPTNILMEFLLGTGCWRHFGSPSRPTFRTTTPSVRPSVHAEEPRAIRFSASVPSVPSVPPVPIASGNSEDRSSLLEISNELRQTLSRLESNTSQVKLHLDSIERRISKMEQPSPDVLPLRTPAPSELHVQPDVADTVASEVTQPPAEDVPEFEPELPTRGRAVFSHQFQPEQAQTETEDDDFSSPTFAFASEKGRSILPFGVLLALLAIIGAFFFFLHSRQGQPLLNGSLSRLKAVRSLFGGAPAAVNHPPAATLPSTPAPTPPAAAAAAPSVPPSQAAPSAPTEGTVGTAPTPSVVSDGAKPNKPNVSPAARPTSDNAKIRYIQSNVMEGYLLSAPRPEYPPLARVNHINGEVALQAVISKTGSIETLRVIRGPQPLRGAAIDAVRNWRYKPYSVDDEPVEVATTVYVDFTLKPPPKIAH